MKYHEIAKKINNKQQSSIEHIKSLVATGCSINNNHLWVADWRRDQNHIWPPFLFERFTQIKTMGINPAATFRTDNRRSLSDVTSFHREIPWNTMKNTMKYHEISLFCWISDSSFNPHVWYVWFIFSESRPKVSRFFRQHFKGFLRGN